MYFWLVASVVCLLYFVICVIYAGIKTAFVPIWAIAGIVFAVCAVLLKLERMNRIIIPVWIKTTYLVLFSLGMALFVVVEIGIFSKMLSKGDSDSEYMIVLGARVKEDGMTKSLKSRLDSAYEYYVNNSSVKIIVSGGQGSDEHKPEAEVMKEYLVEKGVPANSIIEENQSTDTSENFRFSKQYIDVNKKTVIVSNNFHIYRAMKLAKGAGYTNISGIAAPSDKIMFLNYVVREAVGVVKDYVFGNY